MPMTLTQPPALRSCSGAQRTPKPTPASTALMTWSSSRYALRTSPPSASPVPLSAPESLAALSHLLLLLHMQRSLFIHYSYWDPVCHLGSALGLGQLSPSQRQYYRLWEVGTGKSYFLHAPVRTESLCEPERVPPFLEWSHWTLIPTLWSKWDYLLILQMRKLRLGEV